MGSVFSPFSGKSNQESAQRAQTARARSVTGTGADLTSIASDLMSETAPLRSSTVDTLRDVLAGKTPSSLPPFAPARESIESQFRQAREDILGGAARGGQLNKLLANADIARAQSVGQLDADVRTQAFTQALGVGFGAPPQSIAALGTAGNLFGSAANIYGNQAQLYAQQTHDKNQSIGSLAGVAAAAFK